MVQLPMLWRSVVLPSYWANSAGFRTTKRETSVTMYYEITEDLDQFFKHKKYFNKLSALFEVLADLEIILFWH